MRIRNHSTFGFVTAALLGLGTLGFLGCDDDDGSTDKLDAGAGGASAGRDGGSAGAGGAGGAAGGADGGSAGAGGGSAGRDGGSAGAGGGSAGSDGGSAGRDGGSAGAGGGAAGAGGRDGGAAATRAEAVLAATTMTGTAKGSARFDRAGAEVTLTVSIEGAMPGMRGIHIHQNGSCAMDEMGVAAGAAGGHWNPSSAMHGTSTAGHLGDLGNIVIGMDGKGTLTLKNAGWALGTGSMTDVVGKAVVLHAGTDDLASQPNGMSGDRIACGIIRAQ